MTKRILEGYRLAPEKVTDEMQNDGWSAHRCFGADPERRVDDKCWNENDTCRCRIAYDAAPTVYSRMLSAAPTEAEEAVADIIEAARKHECIGIELVQNNCPICAALARFDKLNM